MDMKETDAAEPCTRLGDLNWGAFLTTQEVPLTAGYEFLLLKQRSWQQSAFLGNRPRCFNEIRCGRVKMPLVEEVARD